MTRGRWDPDDMSPEERADLAEKIDGLIWDVPDEAFEDPDYQYRPGGGGKWCLEAVAKSLGMDNLSQNNLKLNFRGAIHGTEKTITTDNPDHYVNQDVLTALARQIYDKIGSNQVEIQRILTNPQSFADNVTRDGIFNGVAGVLEASTNRNQDSKVMLAKLNELGYFGRIESRTLRAVNSVRNTFRIDNSIIEA
jgi:hypothetical protein